MSDVLSKLIVGKKEAVQDDYLLLDPTQVPILSAIGFASPIKNTNFEWVEDGMFATQSSVDGAVTDSGVSIVVDDVEPFTNDSVARIGEELVLVTSVDEGSKTLTVVRGYNGTTAAAISDDEIIEYLFVDSVEGQEARDEDPTSSVGRQTIILKDCNIDSIVLAKFDADEEYLEDEFEFTFDDFEIPEKFSVLKGMV